MVLSEQEILTRAFGINSCPVDDRICLNRLFASIEPPPAPAVNPGPGRVKYSASDFANLRNYGFSGYISFEREPSTIEGGADLAGFVKQGEGIREINNSRGAGNFSTMSIYFSFGELPSSTTPPLPLQNG